MTSRNGGTENARKTLTPECNKEGETHGQQGIPAADGGLRSHNRGDPLPSPRSSNLLQLYVWQEYDLAPEFPTLKGFLNYWERELEGALHSVRVAHHRLIRPSEWQAVDGIFTIQ